MFFLAFMELAEGSIFSVAKVKLCASNVDKVNYIRENAASSVILFSLLETIFQTFLASGISELTQDSFALSTCISLFISILLIFVKVFSVTNSLHASYITIKPTYYIFYYLKPLGNLFLNNCKKILSLIAPIHEIDEVKNYKIELFSALDAPQLAAVAMEEEIDMMRSILTIKDIHIDKIMIPKHKFLMCEYTEEPFVMFNRLRHFNKKNIVIWKDNIDNIIGTINLQVFFKNLVAILNDDFEHAFKASYEEINFSTINYIKSPQFFSNTTSIFEALEFFKKEYQPIFVVNEYHSIIGLVTLDDIVNDILGNKKIQIEKINLTFNNPLLNEEYTDSYICDAQESIRAINREKGWDLPEEEINLGGLILALKGAIVPENTIITINTQDYSFRLIVLKANKKSIKQLLIQVKKNN